MSVDNVTALNARDDWQWLVDHWTDLRGRLRPGGGAALTGVAVQSSERPSPIDLHVSDLLREIEDAARLYGQVLIEEVPPEHGCNGACTEDMTATEDCPDRVDPITTSHMPGLLAQVVERYGHFVTDDLLALDFCDQGHEFRRKARQALERPPAPTFMGPCPVRECHGELYVREGQEAATCRECDTVTTVAEQREWLDGELEQRLMTAAELPRALKILGMEVHASTVRKWVQRERLVAAVDEGDLALYRLKDAKTLAMSGRGGRVAG